MNNLSNRSVSFSEWIRQRRLELQLKQSDLAAELHVTDEAVGHWESGRRRPELNKIPRLAAVLQEQRGEEPDQRRLARAVPAQDGDALAAGDRERDALERRPAPPPCEATRAPCGAS